MTKVIVHGEIVATWGEEEGRGRKEGGEEGRREGRKRGGRKEGRRVLLTLVLQV